MSPTEEARERRAFERRRPPTDNRRPHLAGSSLECRFPTRLCLIPLARRSAGLHGDRRVQGGCRRGSHWSAQASAAARVRRRRPCSGCPVGPLARLLPAPGRAGPAWRLGAEQEAAGGECSGAGGVWAGWEGVGARLAGCSLRSGTELLMSRACARPPKKRVRICDTLAPAFLAKRALPRALRWWKCGKARDYDQRAERSALASSPFETSAAPSRGPEPPKLWAPSSSTSREWVAWASTS